MQLNCKRMQQKYEHMQLNCKRMQQKYKRIHEKYKRMQQKYEHVQLKYKHIQLKKYEHFHEKCKRMQLNNLIKAKRRRARVKGPCQQTRIFILTMRDHACRAKQTSKNFIFHTD